MPALKDATNPYHKTSFRHRLIHWFEHNKRPLPWREEKGWYPIFLSEFLLQQTQVEQALPYYLRFRNRFPTIETLAQATEQEVLTLWAGLGYYARARHLHKAAQTIVSRHGGLFPDNYPEALSLPGIGPYTASAILSIAFNRRHAVVDGNVVRVISRLFGIGADVRLQNTKQVIRETVEDLLDPESPGLFNEGLMELGATVCKPLKPHCTNCPLQSYCNAYRYERTAQFPYKSPPAPKKLNYHYVFIVHNSGRLLLAQRPGKGLLAAMWEFPVIAVESMQPRKEGAIRQLLFDHYGLEGVIHSQTSLHRQTYSHIELHYTAFLADVKANAAQLRHYRQMKWEPLGRLQQYPIHNAHKKLIHWIEHVLEAMG